MTNHPNRNKKPRAAAYVAYLTNLSQTNAATSHAGYGVTPELARANARYWANQTPWVRTVPASRAPRWAVEEALLANQNVCGGCNRRSLNDDGTPTEKHGPGEVCVDGDGNPL